MVSTNHAAGLAIVVPASDVRSQPRGKVKQNAFNSPRKPSSQSNVMYPSRTPNGTPTTPRFTNGMYSSQQPNGMAMVNQPKVIPLQYPSNGAVPLKENGTKHEVIQNSAPRRPNGIPNGPQLKGVNPTRQRLLGVDEALQFSPFSSIVPFSSDIVPTPNGNLPGSQSIFGTTEEQRSTRQPLEFLNEELAKTHGKSSLAQRAKHDLKPYLDQEVVTDFKFKPVKGLSANLKRSDTKTNSTGPLNSPNLGAFANIILQATDLANRYPTPTSPEAISPKSKSISQTKNSAVMSQSEVHLVIPQTKPSLPIPEPSKHIVKQQSPTTPTIQRQVQNKEAYVQNAAISAKGSDLLTPTHLQPIPMVLIPPTSAEARRSDFVTYEEPSAKAKPDASRKRKRESEPHSGANLLQTKDQRAASDEILSQSQELIQEILEAEDSSQANGSGGSSSFNTQYFVMAHYDGREALTLAPAIHMKLESLLLKVINIGRFGDIPVEHLQRLQSLSEGALTSAESSDLRIEPDWNPDEFSSWVSRLDDVDSGLRSARTILRIMAGGREEKQLYSEELLQNVLGLVKKVLADCITPIVELRSSGATSVIFEAASSHKKVISQLLFDANKIMILLGKLLAKVEMAELIVTGIEFFATPLLFVENSFGEKDSIVGIQRFESLRRTAMDLIATIFSRYPAQRLFLFDEILTSLQKLPVSERHARQYKPAEGKNIMLVSALIMQLVQTSSVRPTTVKKGSRRDLASTIGQRENGSEESGEDQQSKTTRSADSGDESNQSEDIGSRGAMNTMQKLSKNSNLLMENAAKSAQYVVRFLIQRASRASKSGESPHRQHLDIFVQDFITVLGVPEWPAAELLLRMVFASCRNIAVENPKSLAPAKNMALELLGMMGSAISELVSSTRHAAKSLENQDSEQSGNLRQMLDDYLDGSLETSEIVMWDGPYRVVAEYLQSNRSDGPHYGSAQAYYIAQWAKAASSADKKHGPETEKLALKLERMLCGDDCFVDNATQVSSNTQSRIAYALTVLTMDFCRQADYILKILLDSVASEQITVRTRSLKSVDKMLEVDPSVLDRARNVKILIANCATDASSMVRDSALTLIGKCIGFKPALEQEFLRHILRMTDDPAAGVRKRSIKMLKEIYVRNPDRSMKMVVADSLLQRAKDSDAGVADLARSTFEDIWLSPFWSFPDLADATAQNKVDFRNQISLIVGTVRRSDKVAPVLIHLLKGVLASNVKNAITNLRVCKSLIATAFDIIIDNFQDAERLEQRHILHTLTIFAAANPRLFSPDQLQSLQPYIANLSGKDDLEVFRSIVVVFRCVLPVLSNVQHGLLREIQKALLQSIAKLGKAELNEVADCLWMINGTLQNPEALLRLTISVLKNLHNMRNSTLQDSSQTDDLKRVKKYIQIAGNFGKHCDFEGHRETFQVSVTWWKGLSVVRLIVESIIPFTAATQPLSLRAEAFDSIGSICQSWPYQFTQQRISTAFQDVLRNGEPELQTIVLSSFREFFARFDRQAEEKGETPAEGDNAVAGEKLGGSMTASEGDGASALIAQRFLKDILSIALASQNASALSATEVIASINRQGLVHPKESGPALVALETSTNQAIADVAFQEHRILHQQHESMFEREYMRAIQEAFRYQRDIVNETLGYTPRPYTAKLHAMFDVIKTSKGKYQKKFLSNFCSKIDFDIAKMDLSGSPPNVLQFSRFLTENLAFFEYGRLEELMHIISCMEKIVADTGSGIAHNISTEVFNITVESMPEATVPGASQDQGFPEVTKPAINPTRLLQLTTASIILSSLWESRTYLRRLYGLNSSQQKREGKGKAVAKDLTKTPSRVPGVNGEKFVSAIADKVNSLKDEESMTQQCKDFVDLLSVDSEVKVAAEGAEDVDRPETPSGDDERDTPMSGGSRGAKRKNSLSINGTPMKKKRGRPSLKRKKSGKSVASDEDWD